MNQQIDLKLIATRVRPPRYAILVNENDKYWKHSLLRVIEINSNYWGGLFNVVIPTNGTCIKKEFWEILNNFRPDYLFVYQQTFKDFQKADPDLFMEFVEKGVQNEMKQKGRNDYNELKDIFIKGYIENIYFKEKFEIKDILKEELINKLNPFYNKKDRAIKYFGFHVNNIKTKSIILNNNKSKKISDFNLLFDDPIVELLLRSYVGSSLYIQDTINNSTMDMLAKRDIEFIFNDFEESNFHELLAFVKNKDNSTPFNLISNGLHGYWSNKYEDHFDRNIVIVVGDTLEDFCYYISLKSLLESVVWLPISIIEKEINESSPNIYQSIIYWLWDMIKDHQHQWDMGNEIIITSFSQNQNIVQQLNEQLEHSFFAEEITLKFEEPKNLSHLYKNTIFRSEEFFRSKIYVEQFFNGTSLNFLNTPMPKSFPNLSVSENHWITDLSILSPSYAMSPQDGYILPPLSIFSKDIFSENVNTYYNSNNTVRFTGKEISFVCPTMGLIDSSSLENQVVSPRIKILNPIEIFTNIFDSIGYNTKLSDKGNYANESLKLFNSLEYLCDALLNEKLNQIFHDYLKNESGDERQKNSIKGVCVSNRSYLTFEEISSYINDQQKAREIIDDYLIRGILYRGYVLLCTNCNNADWYGFSTIDEYFTCNRCYNKNIISHKNWKMPFEPNIYYKLNEVFYQGLKYNMKFPLLSLNYIKSNTKDSFIFSPELSFIHKEKSDYVFECDIICISDGELIIGEVKQNDELPKKLDLYNKIVNELNAQFILSTFADNWSSKNVDKVNKLRWYKAPKFLNKNDLLNIKN